MAGGWLAGACYPALLAITLVYGLRAVLVPTPWQQTTITVYAAFAGIVAESIIIDSDHWRHTFLLLGVLWGLIAATRRYAAQAHATAALARQGGPGVQVFASERSAARLAHQSGGLGVASSNLAAPTIAPTRGPGGRVRGGEKMLKWIAVVLGFRAARNAADAAADHEFVFHRYEDTGLLTLLFLGTLLVLWGIGRFQKKRAASK